MDLDPRQVRGGTWTSATRLSTSVTWTVEWQLPSQALQLLGGPPAPEVIGKMLSQCRAYFGDVGPTLR